MASIRKRGKRYQVRVCIDGKKDAATFATLQEAKAWAETMEVRLSEDDGSLFMKAKRMTFAELTRQYIEQVCPYHKSGRNEARRLRYIISHAWAQESILAITWEEIRNYLESLSDGSNSQSGKPLNPSTVRQAGMLISGVYTWAKDEIFPFLVNPVRQKYLPKASPGRDRRMSEEEEIQLVEGFRQAPTPYYLYAFLFAITSTMRYSEIFALTWQQVNLEEGIISLSDGKTGARKVPLAAEAREMLGQIPRKQGDDRVFPVCKESFRTYFNRMLRRYGIKNLRFHDMRHEGASRWAMRMGNIYLLQKVTGHRTLSMLNRYVNIELGEVVAAMDESMGGDEYAAALPRRKVRPKPSILRHLGQTKSPSRDVSHLEAPEAANVVTFADYARKRINALDQPGTRQKAEKDGSR